MRTVVNHRAATLKVFDPTFFKKLVAFRRKRIFFLHKNQERRADDPMDCLLVESPIKGFPMDLHSKSIKCNKRSPAFSSFKEKNAGLFIVSISILNCHTIHQKSFLERNKFSSSSFTHGAYWSHTRPSYHTPEPSGTYPRSTYMRCAAP